jgi:hypothetical protein
MSKAEDLAEIVADLEETRSELTGNTEGAKAAVDGLVASMVQDVGEGGRTVGAAQSASDELNSAVNALAVAGERFTDAIAALASVGEG